jgi:hypothetical protein
MKKAMKSKWFNLSVKNNRRKREAILKATIRNYFHWFWNFNWLDIFTAIKAIRSTKSNLPLKKFWRKWRATFKTITRNYLNVFENIYWFKICTSLKTIRSKKLNWHMKNSRYNKTIFKAMMGNFHNWSKKFNWTKI